MKSAGVVKARSRNMLLRLAICSKGIGRGPPWQWCDPNHENATANRESATALPLMSS
jgi:hypothetical protein